MAWTDLTSFTGTGGKLTTAQMAEISSNFTALALQEAGAPGIVALNAFLKYNQSSDSIIESKNVSTIDDNAAGRFVINWTTSFHNADYLLAVCGGHAGAGNQQVLGVETNSGTTGGAVGMQSVDVSGFLVDRHFNTIMVVGSMP